MAEGVTGAIRRMILDGSLREDEPVIQDDLAEKLGVSRIPVREALRQLSMEGLVNLHPHRSAEIKTLTLAELVERIELRLWIEPKLFRLAIDKRTDKDIARTEAILDEYSDDMEIDLGKSAEINCRFHVSLYQACDRAMSVSLVQRLLIETGRYRGRMLRRKRAKALNEHAALFEQFRKGDADRGAAMLRQHISKWKTHCLKARD